MQCMIEGQQQQQEAIVAYKAYMEAYYNDMYEGKFCLQDKMDHPVPFMMKSDSNTTYFYQAM